jgi:hypothetical protein
MPRARTPKREPGRPTLLTPKLAKQICTTITSTKAPLEDAAGAAGVHRSTLFMWLQKGRAETSGPYRDFLDAVELARQRGTTLMLGRIALAAQDPKNWAAAKSLLEMTERRRFGAQVRIVQEELDATLDRLEQALTPAEFAKVLSAIAADSGRAETGEAGARASIEDATSGSGSGEAVRAVDAVASTDPVSGA